MANITTTEVGDSIPTIVAAEALGYLQANTVLAQLVARDWDDEVAQAGDTVSISFTGALTVNDKTANNTVTLQTPNDSAVSVVLSNHKEVSFLIEDIAKWFSRPDLQSQYVEDALAVVAEEIDADIAGLYSGFSQTIDATAGLGEDDFRESRRQLNSAKAPLGNRAAVLHEDAEFEMLGIERIVNRDYAESLGGVMADAFTGRAYGFDLFMDQKIQVAAAQAKNLFFHRNAMVLATRPMETVGTDFGVLQRTMNEDGIGLRVTMSYNPDHLGVQVTIDVLYGVAELRDNHAVVVSTSEI